MLKFSDIQSRYFPTSLNTPYLGSEIFISSTIIIMIVTPVIATAPALYCRTQTPAGQANQRPSITGLILGN